MKTLFLCLLFVIFAFVFPFPITYGQESYIGDQDMEGSFPLNSGKQYSFYIDKGDYKGVQLVSQDIQEDFKKMLGETPEIKTGRIEELYPIIIGTLGRSTFIDDLVSRQKIDLSSIRGKRENFQIEVVDDPYSGIGRALVIVGSDKRGTIFGMYDLVEKMGVSPWHWWADVPVKKRENQYIKPGKYLSGTPKVEYRGLFINDEEPAFGNWGREKFGGINSALYERVFKLILRLKGNFLWPAMWGKSIGEDDPKSPKLADTYGVVLGTSHHEPMTRAHVEWERHHQEYGNGKWDYQTNSKGLQDFWRKGFERNYGYENLVTIGMRGDGDEPMGEDTSIALLQDIVKAQRDIITQISGKPAEETPQVWALYKEVQDYYDKGMQVPDDVTLLFSDDNWGNLRRLPDPNEKQRSGGYGIYYHFDYVGGPRNYKWINTTQVERVWEQMNLAYQYGAKKLWVVNVGDIKPMELPISFFLDFAWNPEAIAAEDLQTYVQTWAAQQFPEKYASDIANILNLYTKYNSRRKPELLSADTYSLTHYKEAETVVKDYNALVKKAEEINKALPEEYRDTFFQLVLFPVKASANLNELYWTVAKNRRDTQQGRNTTNFHADKAEALFQKDKELADQYHQVADGKWNHMMSQTHIGYTNWQEPSKQTMPKVQKIHIPHEPAMGLMVEGSDQVWPEAGQKICLPEYTSIEEQKPYINLFNKGEGSFDYKVTERDPWLQFSEEVGSVYDQKRVFVDIDWSQAPDGRFVGSFVLKANGQLLRIEVPGYKVNNEKARGHIESRGYIAMDPLHYTEKSEHYNGWTVIPNLGKTGSAISSFTARPTHLELTEDSPFITYDFYNTHTGDLKIEFILLPSLDFLNKKGLRFAFSIDDMPARVINIQDAIEEDWDTMVSNNVVKIVSDIQLKEEGNHQLKIWAMDSGVTLQKIIISSRAEDTYLGPPESIYLH